MMLVHLNEHSTATLIKNAWLRTIEDGIHPADIYRQDVSEKLVSRGCDKIYVPQEHTFY